LANTAWAISILTYEDDPLCDAISAASIPKLWQFGPQELSNTVWAFAVRGIKDRRLAASGLARSQRNIRNFGSQVLANTSWAFANLSVPDNPLLHAISSSASRLIGQLHTGQLAERFLHQMLLDFTAIAWALSFLLLLGDTLYKSIRSAAL